MGALDTAPTLPQADIKNELLPEAGFDVVVHYDLDAIPRQRLLNTLHSAARIRTAHFSYVDRGLDAKVANDPRALEQCNHSDKRSLLESCTEWSVRLAPGKTPVRTRVRQHATRPANFACSTRAHRSRSVLEVSDGPKITKLGQAQDLRGLSARGQVWQRRDRQGSDQNSR